MDSYKRFQKQLIAVANSVYRDEERLSDRVLRAFEAVPRHLFVERYRNIGSPEWFEVTPDNLEQHLATLYADRPLVLYGSEEDFRSRHGTRHVSTISQPSFVLRLLDLLDIQEGNAVFELGAASGWNAALMSWLTGPRGEVVSAEIIQELARSAVQRLGRLEYRNVEIIEADGGDGCPRHTPFDRAMFTAGAFDLPKALHEQVKEGGRLVFVLKNKGGSDNLIVLRKAPEHFECIYAMPCGFVPMTGKYHLPEMEEQQLEEILGKAGIDARPVMQRKFWWGSGAAQHFLWHTSALRSFLSLWDRNFCALEPGSNHEESFGWLEEGSLVVARPGTLTCYGDRSCPERLISKIKYWVDLGMPTLANLTLKVYPGDVEPAVSSDCWVSRRKESTFVWSLPT